MELFYHPLSRYSQKVLIALYEKQANFYPRITDLGDPLSRKAFHQFYPPAKLPLLKTQDGQLIPESSIIIEYLDRHFENSTQLLPPEPQRNLQVRLFDRIIDNDINNTLFQLEKLKHIEDSNEFEIKQLEKQLLTQFQRLDAQLTQHHWVCGDSFTLADCALIPCLSYSFQHLNLLDLDEVVRYWQQAQLRGAWMLVQEEVLQAEMEETTGVRGIP
ncbi:glutathione S-transferase family protein [Shewanella sp. JNE10-2]|uniref:glutathione S-transferase family protein n=1 Tax=unclassified Shewanella TaxID=196818 RepID=UPI00200352FA|nr:MULTISPECIES: glutathione S-transferase family protein [unclassified Shewanella]MCK7631000.1 glutathione S-transferase family protein [Shewanella sp. JNE9-1]MCK7646253.1 glutathione S-transferase family protein [Shewanella sp. JNE3-1]MCK7654208.1 glutathione S-transferase family protein [Shewanella sp. JNE4-1]UPO28043.1 glutathione S-transferase family protein [Shewanella sp. JNE10-2]UPO35250.1 glutathione S-transferase family protein [Shewanella sp. JNE7]